MADFKGIKDGNTFKDCYDTTARNEINGIKEKIPSVASSSNKMATANDITGVQNAVKANTKLIKDTVGFSGKNKLIPNPTKTVINHGITFTTNADNSVKMVGTTTDTAIYRWNITLPAGKYILHGRFDNAIWVGLYNSATQGYFVSTLNNDNVEFTLTEEKTLGFTVRVGNPYVIESPGFTIYPMIVDGDCLDLSYEPYHSNVVNILKDAEVIKGKNLYKCNATSKTDSYGLTWTVNSADNNIITVNGTPTAFEAFNTYSNMVLPAGDYILNGVLENTTNININGIVLRNGTTFIQSITPTVTNNEFYFTIPANVSYDNLQITLKRSQNNVACTGTIRLMVRLATETDPTYEPFYIQLKNSMFPRSEQAVLGAKNLFSTNNIAAGSGLVTISDNGKTINVKNATAGTYQMVKFDMPVEKTTDYTFTVDIDYVSGAGEIIISNTAENNVLARINSDVTTDRQWSATFNSGELSVIRFRMYCTRATSETGELNYNNALLRLASDPDDTYVPYAMTNKELTDENKSIYERLGWGSPYTEGTEITTAHVFKPIVTGASFIVVIKHYTSATTFDFRLGILTTYTENSEIKFAFQMLVDKQNYPTVTSVEQIASGQIKFTFSAKVYATVQMIKITV